MTSTSVPGQSPVGPTPSTDLRGRVALVTGAAGGLGAAHASLLARLGAAVVVNDTGVDPQGRHPDPRRAEDVARGLRDAGAPAVADTSDISTFTGAADAVQRAIDEFGRLDILINNAGIQHAQSVQEITEDDLWAALRVNTVGTVATMRAAFPIMREQQWGRIVNTLSEAALRTELASGIAYATAKSAVWGATMSAALEGRPHGITVNALSPGALTRMSSAFLSETGIPPGLDLSPERVSEAIVGLFTDEAGDISGRVVHTAGGYLREFIISRVDDTDLIHRLGRTAAAISRG
jgi:NAD(P)-dependent dehydrogenase (short-subunit alcohol dehydrogenase family)